MKDLIVSKQIAEKLKTIGYDQKTMFGYNKTGNIVSKISITIGGSCKIFWDNHDNELLAPTFQEAIDWFREKHDIIIDVGKIFNGSDGYHFALNLEWYYFEGTYYEAREQAILKCIELCQKEK